MTLELSNVSITLGGRRLVKGLNLRLSPGEVVGLLGPNGAGKTTTFNLVIGLLSPDHGEVTMNGERVTYLPMPERARRGVGYLPQEASVFRNLTVRENLDIALEQTDLSPEQHRDRRQQLIEDFHLTEFINRRGFQLSGGERRRCEVARAMASGAKGPTYLLLDEPFAGIDPLAVADLQLLIEELRSRGMGILITDHNVRETLAITDRAYILNAGAVLASGRSDEVAADPQVRRYYLGEGFQL
ncbi:LPS export ABC transporter ATP-binding protein [Synechococcus sp. MU1642]|uniref:LPS export ABC transporter ATP-binding protein n=1 Tax=Synechococcus sp. MU1642 TaxID=2508348 RepID=UPI001CF7F55B|nr:LPS export ABC transporter ATP-binding protein [Synechococcus sp. MU1642]MCB4406774.1 LPS export ABC transporter ATP-binding protein [Synechococcus sp. MU1642]